MQQIIKGFYYKKRHHRKDGQGFVLLVQAFGRGLPFPAFCVTLGKNLPRQIDERRQFFRFFIAISFRFAASSPLAAAPQKRRTRICPACSNFWSGIAVSRFLREPSAKICQGKLTNDGNFFVFYNNKFSFCRVVPIDSGTTEKTDKDSSLSVFSVVPLVGVEPTRYRYHGILSPARLPIPPQRHYSVRCNIFSRHR